MSYSIEAKDKIEYNCNDTPFSYKQGLHIADEVGKYLKKNSAVLVTGPGDLSSKAIQTWNNAGEWVYHVNDTTLFSEIRPFRSINRSNKMIINIGTAGKNSKKVIKDLQKILDDSSKLSL